MAKNPTAKAGRTFILGLIFSALTVAIYLRVGATLSRAQNIALLIFRLLGIALVLLLLLQPSRLEIIPPPITNRVTLVAVDQSRSMARRDVEQGTRADAARSILADAEITAANGDPADDHMRLFKFSDTATPVNSAARFDTAGTTTRVHTSITNILGSLRANEGARALILLTDGHDFELVIHRSDRSSSICCNSSRRLKIRASRCSPASSRGRRWRATRRR